MTDSNPGAPKTHLRRRLFPGLLSVPLGFLIGAEWLYPFLVALAAVIGWKGLNSP